MPEKKSMYDQVQEALVVLRQRAASAFHRLDDAGEIGIILGSGLGGLVEQVSDPVIVAYSDIPHFPVSTVAGHAGRLVFGRFQDRRVVMMEGRPHYYEGYPMRRIGFPIYLLKFLGIKTLLITNACGGINRDFQPGTLMIIDDFINLVSDNPLRGENDERLGPRFPDMSEPYDFELIEKAEAVGRRMGLAPARGVYAGFWGPYFETRAEIRSIASMGADAVGMSTVPETIVANHAGLRCLGISCITNMATGIQQGKHSHQKVLETAERASADLSRWIQAIVGELPD